MSTFGSIIELSSLDGTDGFQINDEAAGDYSGRSVASAGDINGDGIDDLIIGARGPMRMATTLARHMWCLARQADLTPR